MKLVHARWEFLLSVNASVRQHVSAPSPSCRVFSIHSHDTVTQPRWITGGVGVGGGNIQRSTRAKVNSPIFNLATQIAPEECAVSDPI